MRLVIAGILTLIIYGMICIYGRKEAAQVEKLRLPARPLMFPPENIHRILNNFCPFRENIHPPYAGGLPEEEAAQTFVNV